MTDDTAHEDAVLAEHGITDQEPERGPETLDQVRDRIERLQGEIAEARVRGEIYQREVDQIRERREAEALARQLPRTTTPNRTSTHHLVPRHH